MEKKVIVQKIDNRLSIASQTSYGQNVTGQNATIRNPVVRFLNITVVYFVLFVKILDVILSVSFMILIFEHKSSFRFPNSKANKFVKLLANQ